MVLKASCLWNLGGSGPECICPSKARSYTTALCILTYQKKTSKLLRPGSVHPGAVGVVEENILMGCVREKVGVGGGVIAGRLRGS